MRLPVLVLVVCVCVVAAGCPSQDNGSQTPVPTDTTGSEGGAEPTDTSDDGDGDPEAGSELADEARLSVCTELVDDDKWPPTSTGSSTSTEASDLVMGVSDSVIRFGQSAALSGPAAVLGQGMQLGIRAAFYEQNIKGGVAGRSLELISVDDCYEPVPALYNTERLIAQHNVFALIGATGTPTSEVAAPAASRHDVPYIGPFTGAGLLRTGAMENVVNFRASYSQEVSVMVRRLQEDLGYERVAVVFQDDSYGREGYNGVVEALKEIGKKPAAIAYYTRNTVIVKGAVLDLRAGDPDAVIIIGAYLPTANIVRWSRKVGFNPVFMSVSFVGADALAEEFRFTTTDGETGSDGVGVYVTQVVPFPRDHSNASGENNSNEASDSSKYSEVVDSYTKALDSYNQNHEIQQKPSFISFEGYLAGRMAIEGLKMCEEDTITRQCFLDRLLDSDSLVISGFELKFNDEALSDHVGFDNQGSDQVFLTVINEDGELEPVTVLNEQMVVADK